ncbi:hypothetical protein [Micromonospora sp. NBC_01796]|uniref:hypothetical protein n=1 Tax=Micromonospora sp. NBC_01796 TaxID=2975987 RepID=UPI002DD8837C|nr:hypothetical protein [Micromonospora sp. NBC_01796]WSA87936.1 hypothetical protein OIE47_10195 [Micromonospora sp. NBC_01796]
MDNEDEYAIALLRRLDDEPSTPSRVDLGRAIIEGGRRRRTRRALGGGGAVVLVAVMVATVPVALTALRPDPSGPKNQAAEATAPATGKPAATRPAPTVAAPTGCSVQRLPLPDKEPMSLVTGADPTGRFIAGRTYPDKRQDGYPILIWDNGVPHRIVLPGADQALDDINTSGVAVGSGWLDDGPHAYVYRDGKVSPLPAKGSAEARAINDAGQIVGVRGEAVVGSQPILWPNASAQPVDLPLPGPGWVGQVAGIDEDGTVAGVVWEIPRNPGRTESQDPGTPKNPRSGMARSAGYLWLPDGSVRELPKPTVQGQPADAFLPRSIRNGWIIGNAVSYTENGDQTMTAARFYLPTNEFVDFPTRAFDPENGNGQGWASGFLPDRRLALLTDTMTVELPFIEPHKLENGDRALTMSDDGRIVAGQSEDADNVIQAVVWNCR